MANVLELYEEQMKSLNIQERLSLELEWDKKRSDIYKEYIEHKGSKNIIQEFMKGMMDTEYCDERGKITTLAEKMIKEAIMNESGKMGWGNVIKLK